MSPRVSARHFFNGFRQALAKLPAGLLRANDPAPPGKVAHVQELLGWRFPDPFSDFLRSWDGADLFHESLVLRSVEALATVDIEGERGLVFADSAAGETFVLRANQTVLRLSDDGDERWLAGSSFERWLDATVAREQLLYDPSGEFVLEAFEADGEELVPRFALRAAERALRKDPDSAVHHHDHGVAARRLGREALAESSFARAAELDPTNPWPRFDRGRVLLGLDRPADAAMVFDQAGTLASGLMAARFWAWAALAARRAGNELAAADARRRALERDADLLSHLQRAVAAADEDEDAAAAADAHQLLMAFDPPSVAPRLRLPLAGG